MTLHVLVGYPVRDALVAQGRHQPIIERGGVVAFDCRTNGGAAILVSDLLNQVRGPGEATNPMNQPNRMIES